VVVTLQAQVMVCRPLLSLQARFGNVVMLKQRELSAQHLADLRSAYSKAGSRCERQRHDEPIPVA
jgi:hypothetical protein